MLPSSELLALLCKAQLYSMQLFSQEMDLAGQKHKLVKKKTIMVCSCIFYIFCPKLPQKFWQVSFTGHRSHQNQKAISNTGDARFTRDSQEVYRYFHATNVSLYNFNEKFLGVVSVLNGLKYSFHICSVTYFIVIR